MKNDIIFFQYERKHYGKEYAIYKINYDHKTGSALHRVNKWVINKVKPIIAFV